MAQPIPFLFLEKPSEFSRLKEEPSSFDFDLAWREGIPEIPRESRGVKGLGRVIGVFTTSSGNVSGTEPVQDHDAHPSAQHSTPRKCTTTCQVKAFTASLLQEYAPAEDGESRNPTRTKGHRTDAHRLGSSPVFLEKNLPGQRAHCSVDVSPAKVWRPLLPFLELAIGFCPRAKLAV